MVTGLGSSPAFRVTYRRVTGPNPGNVTNAVTGTGLTVDLATGEAVVFAVDITGRDAARPGTQRKVWVRAADGTAADRVFLVARRPTISGEQRRILGQINATRRGNGRAPVALQPQLARKAHAWAERMARNGRLSHSSLAAGVPAGWRARAENVGYGSSLTGCTTPSCARRATGATSWAPTTPWARATPSRAVTTAWCTCSWGR